MSLYPIPKPTFFGMLPDGTPGIRATLSYMRQVVKVWRKDPGIRQLAVSLTRNLPQGDISSEVAALHAFVRDNIRYTNDTNNVETLQTPKATLELGAGDCDDKSILLASLLESIGRRARFVALAMAPSQEYSHVAVQVLIGRNWYMLETIRDVPAGWEPANITRIMVAHI